ncbi:MAG: UDP-glucose/GDP-mannose dehydrogenase family protein [Candidatus Undinarchaeales archaeon]
MKITVIGTGYVGLITGVGLASEGHDVTCVDIVPEKVDLINKGKPPIHEKGLSEMLSNVLEKGNFRASLNLEGAVKDSKIAFICVGTPSRKDGSINLEYVEKVSEDIGDALKEMDDYPVVVVKSTVIPGTSDSVVIPKLEEKSGKKAGKEFGVAMTPEFLREGKALDDFMNPDRVVIGAINKKTYDILEPVLTFEQTPVVSTDIKSAEMIKYASNAFLATKISFVNEIGNICKKFGIDSYDVMKAVGLDHRISKHFLRSGVGFGGSCLPKDVKALRAKSKDIDYSSKLLDSVLFVNELQRKLMVGLTEKKLGILKDKKVAVLGVAFKAHTDDIREAPSIEIIEKLLSKGAEVKAYDPEALENAKEIFKDKINYCSSKEDALKNADACLIITEWPEFKNVDFSGMNNKIVIDGRNILENRKDVDYEGLCW